MARPTWEPTFLLALEYGRSVSRACVEAEVARSVVYERRACEPEFAARWLAAQATAEARLRAAFLGRVQAEIASGASPFRLR